LIGAVGALLLRNGSAAFGLGLLSSVVGILTGQSVAYSLDGIARRNIYVVGSSFATFSEFNFRISETWA
jgi:hypothetical protein